MMGLTDSIKAKLFDSFSTSFIASYFISAILINHKYILIYFSETKDIDSKLTALSQHYLGFEHIIIFPILIALFYTLLFPILNNWLLWVTERYKNKSKIIKMTAQGKRAIDDEDKEHLINEIYRLKKELGEQKKFVSKLEIDSNKEVIKKETQIQEKNKLIEDYIKEIDKSKDIVSKIVQEKKELTEVLSDKENEVKDLTNNINKIKNINKIDEDEKNKLKENLKSFQNQMQEISDANSKLFIQVEQLQKENKKLNNIISTNDISVNFENEENLSPNEIKVLKALGKNNYKSDSQYYDGFIDLVTKWVGEPRFLIEEIIPKLIKNGYIFKEVSVGSLQKVSIPEKGRRLILKILNDVNGQYSLL